MQETRGMLERALGRDVYIHRRYKEVRWCGVLAVGEGTADPESLPSSLRDLALTSV